jgi:hypothetical protein
MSSWLYYGEEFGTTRDNILDPNLQFIVTKHMLEEGKWKHWLNCGRKVTRELGYAYPVRDI